MKHGKKHLIFFNNTERAQLRKYFRALDKDGSGSIGIDELEEPFISFGMARTQKDILEVIKDVDKDGSGQIEFEEFLEIIKQSTSGKKSGGSNGGGGKNLRFFRGVRYSHNLADN